MLRCLEKVFQVEWKASVKEMRWGWFGVLKNKNETRGGSIKRWETKQGDLRSGDTDKSQKCKVLYIAVVVAVRIAQSCLTLCSLMGCNTPGFPVPHHLPKFAQVHVHGIGDTVQPSHPLTPSTPSAHNLSRHQGLFQWVSCPYQVTKILELQLQHQSFPWVFRADFP